MQKIFALVLGLLGLDQGTATAADVKTIDPRGILFSTPTLEDKIGDLEPVARVSESDLVLHEDDWRQLEFYPVSRLAEIEGVLRELKAFERQHRRPVGWSDVFVRKVPALPVLSGPASLGDLSVSLGRKPKAGPVLFSGSNTITGRIAHGFSFDIVQGLSLYGVVGPAEVQILGASVNGGDLALTKVFAQLNASYHLILVDWRAQMLITGVSPNGSLAVWKP